MKLQILEAMKKMYRRPLYRILMFILGLPTFLVTLAVWLTHNLSSGKKDAIEKARKELMESLEADGTAASLRKKSRTLSEKQAGLL